MNRTPEYLSKNCSICSLHFEQQFLPKFCNQRRRLSKDAKPTLFDVPNPPPLITATRKGTVRPDYSGEGILNNYLFHIIIPINN